jgi:hypothetical protein
MTLMETLISDRDTRRYGLSDGTPNEKGACFAFSPLMQVESAALIGMQLDAQTGLDYLLQDSCYKQTPIVCSSFCSLFESLTSVLDLIWPIHWRSCFN